MKETRRCAICGKSMKEFKGIFMCLSCNDKYGEYYNFFSSAVADFKNSSGKDVVMIECPGVTIYDETNSNVIRGVKWNDPQDFSKGYVIVGSPMYAPGHKPKRVVPSDKRNNIARCKACQDFTVRMRIFNNQKMKGEFTHESPLMPRDHPRDGFSPRNITT